MNRRPALHHLQKFFALFATCSCLYLLLPGDKADISDVLVEERQLLHSELEEFQYPEDLYTQSNLPLSIIILSSWRSGSSFLGNAFNAHPAVYYHYEPLYDFGTKQISDKTEASQAVGNLRMLLQCNYTGLGKQYLEHMESNPWMFKQNTRLWRQCQQHPHLCWNTEFLDPFCSLFPFQLMKLVRLRLRETENLLADPNLNVRVLLLVRDPRGTYSSRKELGWCRETPQCIDPSLFCADFAKDYESAQELSAKYPKRFRVVLYEDLCREPHLIMQELLQFVGLTFHSNVQRYLYFHTILSFGDASSTFRNSRTAANRWRKELSTSEVQWIVEKCSTVLENWKYDIQNTSHY